MLDTKESLQNEVLTLFVLILLSKPRRSKENANSKIAEQLENQGNWGQKQSIGLTAAIPLIRRIVQDESHVSQS
jgi:hypothetical protein